MVDDVKSVVGHEYICIYNSEWQHHMIVQKDYILIVAPMFADSEVLASTKQVKGKCIITLKTMQQIPCDDDFEIIMEALGAKLIGKRTELVLNPRAADKPKVEVITLLPSNPKKH